MPGRQWQHPLHGYALRRDVIDHKETVGATSLRNPEKERRQKNCNNARDRYQRIISASRLYDLDEQGNRVTLTDDQRARSTERARAEVEQWCGG